MASGGASAIESDLATGTTATSKARRRWPILDVHDVKQQSFYARRNDTFRRRTSNARNLHPHVGVTPSASRDLRHRRYRSPTRAPTSPVQGEYPARAYHRVAALAARFARQRGAGADVRMRTMRDA